MLTVELPMPPSIWKLYNGFGNKRRKSKLYKQWIDEAGWFLIQQRNAGGKHKQIKGDIAVEFEAYRPAGKKADIDNLLKASLDLLTTTGTICDDSQVVELTARWVDEGPPCVIRIRRTEAMAA
ncbi:RusA family crossover junction endodeoxyribonuclease [Nitratireductor basaltis]|uniref:Endodeoxyribonuclease RUS n=1 Tax=Nitratireductor basaltis TaxID=472175 RepID=A0A084UDL7_9HYPH|nr:RusA family crossover junction endodeoxyribonuclease [Nitratireductor basaltis]KFB11053.1 endodeoxyribonuclease RUS [Nitratireductor basaltis]